MQRQSWVHSRANATPWQYIPDRLLQENLAEIPAAIGVVMQK